MTEPQPAPPRFQANPDGSAPMMQPEGVCPSCDHRRRLLTEAKRRSRKARIDRVGEEKTPAD